MPLTFDLPYAQLLTYQGLNPRPADFDPYWDDSLAEMRLIHPKAELIPSDFQPPYAECLDLYFTGIGNARLHARVVRPRHAKGSNPAVLMFHGYSGNAGNWVDKLPYAAMGFTVAALDCRGQAGTSQDTGGQPGMTWHGHIIRGIDGRPQDLLYRSIFLDTAQLAYLVMNLEHVDPSQGGALTLACAALTPEIKRAAPLFPFLSDYKRVWELDLDANAYAEIRDYFRWRDPTHLAKRRSLPVWVISISSISARAFAQKFTWPSACGTRFAPRPRSLRPTTKSSLPSDSKFTPILLTRNSTVTLTAFSNF